MLIEATLRELFGAGEDLLARDLTDDRAVSRAPIDQRAGGFGGHGPIGSYLFGVTLLGVAYDPDELARELMTRRR